MGNDIVIRLFWSPPTADVGDVHWQLRYRLVQSSITQADSALTSTDYVQSTPGVDDRILSTDSNLIIAGVNVAAADQIVLFNIERLGGSFLDTYGFDARIHAIRVEYSGKGVSE